MEKVVLITGGAKGLGRNIVLAFARQGYRVAYTYHGSTQAAETLTDTLRGMNSPFLCRRVDLAAENEVQAFVAEAHAVFGRIDALVCNGGIYKNALISNMSAADFSQVLTVNLIGSFLCVKYVFPIMEMQGTGRILMMSSIMGETGIYGACSYAASKAGLIGLMKSVALEGARHGITANAVSIGYTNGGMSLELSDQARTAMINKIPLRCAGDADALAAVLTDLCKDEMRYINGQVIRFNGGMYM